MAEYLGEELMVVLQRSIRSRIGEIDQDPLRANGGRIVNILDPDAYGWGRIHQDVERDGFVGLTMVDLEPTMEKLQQEFGSNVQFPYWDAFVGDPESCLTACENVISEQNLPAGWQLTNYTNPDDGVIDESQHLNLVNGVAPAPAYFLRGDHVPSILTCLTDESGKMAACASAAMRYHPDGPLSNWMFAGGVSVDPSHRRMGLGSFVNACLLRDSHRAFGWSKVLEQARTDNFASVGMITKCGLRHEAGRVTIVINRTDSSVTR